ncbi:zinc-binding dehydrogenase [Nocardia sp. NPDC050193]
MVIVAGVGGIGINAVLGARHAGAGHIIAADPVALKREVAPELGATEAVAGIEEAADLARGFTNGQGADSAILAIGLTLPEHIAAAFAAVRKAGIVVVTGLGRAGTVGIPVSPGELTLYQKQLCGSMFGACVELGFDVCVDRTRAAVVEALDRHCPDGIDVYLDNVGGAVGAAAFDRLREHGRYVVCGMASEYNNTEPAAGPPLRPVLRKRLRVEGFVVYDHYSEFDAFRSELEPLRRSGAVKYRYEIVHGLSGAPDGLVRLLSGRNRGKMIVELTADGERLGE